MYQFRSATKSDYAAICALITSRDELFRVYPAGRYPLTVEQLAALAEQREELTVATLDGEVVGFANFYDREAEKSVFIGNVVVAKQHRGKGLGRALLTTMINKAFGAHDLPEVRLSVFSENSRALLLYAGLGFSPYRVDERVDAEGRRLALIHMRLHRH